MSFQAVCSFVGKLFPYKFLKSEKFLLKTIGSFCIGVCWYVPVEGMENKKEGYEHKPVIPYKSQSQIKFSATQSRAASMHTLKHGNPILFKENQDPQSRKRLRGISGSEDVQHPLKKRKNSTDATQRLPYRPKDRDWQFQRLNTQSEFVEGDNCAKLRWVEDLTIFCEGATSLDYIEIPADIHNELAYVGNHLRAFSEQFSGRQSFVRNILIPHVSFVVKRPTDNSHTKEFIKGGYLNFDEENYSDAAMAFISGRTSMPWNALGPYNKYKSAHNSSPEMISSSLPFIRVMSGTEVESLTGNQYAYNEDSHSKYHTEQWFYEMLLHKPEAVIDQAKKILDSADKIVHIIFDFYSWWDVCRDCQDRFRTEYFKGNVQQKLEEEFKRAGFRFSKTIGILPVFRVSSYKKHHPDSLDNMAGAGGGSHVRNGFEAKVLNQTQVVISTRQSTDAFDYNTIYKKVYEYNQPQTRSQDRIPQQRYRQNAVQNMKKAQQNMYRSYIAESANSGGQRKGGPNATGR